ncbi:MAG TPA: hypothetical protein GX692_03095 [Acholeplasmataceae bacterium]|jgi:hypothetical protein|nr:hypothetical protein [Acholeplasmataceae bacterium]
MKNYYITKTDKGYQFYILAKEEKGKKKKKKNFQEEIGLELLYKDSNREK